MPVVDSIEELNERFAEADGKDDARRIANRAASVGQDFAVERDTLRPLPSEQFATWLTLTPRVDRYARITVRQCYYSVPARLIGSRVRVQLGASAVTVFNGRVVVAWHERITVRGGSSLTLDHYLEVLQRKPGALPGATALAQARAAGVFTAQHDAFWAAARAALGDGGGTRALIEVLLLHRHLRHAEVLAGITAALAVGSVNPDVVAVEARKATQPAATQQPQPTRADRVVSLPQRRSADLPADHRPPPSVTAYDQLLGRVPS